ncbi:MAG: hypothetical protein QOD86_2182 [Miltoncostaeaceae bacterium]|nr:hypothetical protein [Miltoncostaeaceae bacterium]
MTVLVAGALANKPGNGGEAWVRISWAIGLRRLGLDVHFVEQISEDALGDADGHLAGSSAGAFFREVVGRFGLDGAATLVCEETGETIGLAGDDLRELARSAAALINLSGHLSLPWLVDRVPCRVFVDLDPGFTQAWHAQGHDVGVVGHHHHYTVGLNVGATGCPIPAGGVDWRPVIPPVLLEEWPVADDGAAERFTTVARWRASHGPVEIDGTTHGLKVHEFRKVLPFPRRVAAPVEIALDIHPADGADLAALNDNGWRVVDPRRVAGDPWSFRDYVRGSGAEFSVAQGAYAGTGSGWVSDRTAHYLASGRPALVQDTGAGSRLPLGEGLVTFSSLDEAVAGAERILADYPAHRAAARELAERHFASERVLGRLAEEVGLAP